MNQNRLLGWAKYGVYLGVMTLALLVVAEAALRIFFGKPEGYFHHRPSDGTGLYLPSRTLRMTMGPIPYTVKTNALGFRGPEIDQQRPADTYRILALGDSVTDGFYVDNEDTYPVQLQNHLNKGGRKVEVVNAARGDASIDKEFYILKQFGMKVQPNVVVLAFVTNDIDDIRGRTKEQLISVDGMDFEPAAKSEALLFARTALGEMLLDWSLKVRYENYRAHERMSSPKEQQDRYAIEGARDFQENLRVFMEDHVKTNDSILAYDPLTEEHHQLIDNYLYGLQHLKAFLDEEKIDLVFVYVPGYNQVHDEASNTELPERLAAGCAELDIPYFDLTPAFREEVREHTLHLAPIDFHPTPYGNEVMGREIGSFLEERFLRMAHGVAEHR